MKSHNFGILCGGKLSFAYNNNREEAWQANRDVCH